MKAQQNSGGALKSDFRFLNDGFFDVGPKMAPGQKLKNWA